MRVFLVVILGVHSLISAVLISRRHNNGLCLIKPCAMMSMLSLRSKRAYCTTAAFILTSPVETQRGVVLETNYVHWDAKGLIKLLSDVPSHVYLQAARWHQLNARSTNKCRQSREAHVVTCKHYTSYLCKHIFRFHWASYFIAFLFNHVLYYMSLVVASESHCVQKMCHSSENKFNNKTTTKLHFFPFHCLVSYFVIVKYNLFCWPIHLNIGHVHALKMLPKSVPIATWAATRHVTPLHLGHPKFKFWLADLSRPRPPSLSHYCLINKRQKLKKGSMFLFVFYTCS